MSRPSHRYNGRVRVLHVITDSDRRGAQVFASDLQSALAPRADIESHLVALAAGSVGGLDVKCLGPTRLHRSTLAALRRRMRDADVTIAHGSSTLPACAIASIGVTSRFITRQISETSFWANSRARRARVRFYQRRAAGVVALSSGAAKELTRVLGVSPDKITVIPNGVPRGNFRPANRDEQQRARQRFGLQPQLCTLLAIGAHVPEKGVDMVIRALEAAPDAQLLVVGDGPQRGALQELAAGLTPGRVVFAGLLKDPSEAYAAGDLMVLASRGGDSMPAVLIESGFCGIASVATDVGAIAETLKHESTGLVVPAEDQTALDDAVRALCNDPARRTEMGRAAMELCLRKFEIGVVTDAWIEVLAAAARGSKRLGP